METLSRKILFSMVMIALPVLGAVIYANGGAGWHGNNGWHAGWNRAPDGHSDSDQIAAGAPYYYGDFQYDYVPGRTPTMSEYEYPSNSGPILYDNENGAYFDFSRF